MRINPTFNESLLQRLRLWKTRNPAGVVKQAKRHFAEALTRDDLARFASDWLDTNWDRVIVKPGDAKAAKHSHTAEIIRIPRATVTPEQRAEARRVADIAARTKADNFFQEFAARIWDTVLPNGISLRKSTGADLVHAGGVYARLARKVGKKEKTFEVVKTQDLFSLIHPDEAKESKESA